jgi:hypothetical protein
MTAFEAVGRGSIPRWGADLSLGCDGGTRLCGGRRPGSTPGRDTDLMTLMSHGVAAACKAAFSGFDSHRRLFEMQAPLMSSVQRQSGHPTGFGSVCSEHGF